ncbi:MAG: hypothetical protein M5U26_00065 [Planctomycetota bacterium]|nr:hypothetical protein [Planctomycetota bacterium]
MRDVLNEIRAAIRVEAEARGYTAVMRTPYSDTELSLEDDLAPAPETKEDHPSTSASRTSSCRARPAN